MVLENIELLMEMVGLKMLMGGTPGLFSIMAWFPDTINSGKTTEKTQPAITWEIFLYFLSLISTLSYTTHLALRHVGDDRQGQPEPQEVRPVSLNLVESLVQLNPLGEPLVLEAVEGMEQALVDEVDGGSEDFYREQSEDLALNQEDDLHHNGEHGVGYHDGDGKIYQRSALGRPEMVY